MTKLAKYEISFWEKNFFKILFHFEVNSKGFCFASEVYEQVVSGALKMF